MSIIKWGVVNEWSVFMCKIGWKLNEGWFDGKVVPKIFVNKILIKSQNSSENR